MGVRRAMGFLSGLFNKPKTPTTPVLLSIMPDIASSEIKAGRLPQLNVDTIILSQGEYCHFVDKASLTIEKNVTTHYEGRSSGWSFRVMKGLSYRIGGFRGVPVREIVQDYTKGILYITNRRIIFVAQANGFDKKIKNITAVVPYSNAVGLQFGSKTYNLLLPQPELAAMTLQILK
jgi:hypothetical protein